ncbi:MAG: DUF2029 domain-containing protein [Chloroflexi bacterium]|nr:DUF2029 domain-containing protein [Chloroflexota bacterium]
MGAALIALLLFAYYAFTWRNVYNFRAAMDVCAQPFCDFAAFYYPMGEAIFQTKLPIEGFVYSPFIAILLAAFPPFGLDASLLLWGILQAVFFIFCLFAFRQLVPAKLPIQLLFVALALSSFPLLHNFKWGQVGVFTTVPILGVLLFLERGHRAFAAALLVFAASFKFGIQRARLPHADLWSFHILFLTIPFVLTTSWPVDLVYIPFAQGLLVWMILEGDKTLSWKHPLPARKVASLLLLASIVISNIVFFNLIGDRIAYGSVGFIFWADLLLLVVSYMELLPSTLRQIRRTYSSIRLMDQKGRMQKSLGTFIAAVIFETTVASKRGQYGTKILWLHARVDHRRHLPLETKRVGVRHRLGIALSRQYVVHRLDHLFAVAASAGFHAICSG